MEAGEDNGPIGPNVHESGIYLIGLPAEIVEQILAVAHAQVIAFDQAVQDLCRLGLQAQTSALPPTSAMTAPAVIFMDQDYEQGYDMGWYAEWEEDEDTEGAFHEAASIHANHERDAIYEELERDYGLQRDQVAIWEDVGLAFDGDNFYPI